MTISNYSKIVRYEVDKLDGVMNLGLWQVQVKDMLTQLELVKALKERTEKTKKPLIIETLSKVTLHGKFQA